MKYLTITLLSLLFITENSFSDEQIRPPKPSLIYGTSHKDDVKPPEARSDFSDGRDRAQSICIEGHVFIVNSHAITQVYYRSGQDAVPKEC